MSALDTMLDAGVTYRKIDHWCKRGWLRPVRLDDDGRVVAATEFGTGIPRRWPEPEIAVALLMHKLTMVGFKCDAAAKVARRVVESDDVTVSGELTLAELAPGLWIGVKR